MKKLAIVAVGYNRVHSMERLLKSLLRADYKGDKVPLYISIDNSGKKDVEEMAKAFNWPYGEKTVLTYPERQGLRQHILGCGRLLDEYDAIAMLEDDVVVSDGFYNYMKQAVEFYADDERVAGISLYCNRWNEFANAPFTPMHSEYDTYFFQFAESRGQIWMKCQWKTFMGWYEANKDQDLAADNLPVSVSNWPKSSWKKYHIKYCVATNRYFAYPYVALATIFSEPGTNTIITSTSIQVDLHQGSQQQYCFPLLSSADAVYYDAFYERQVIEGCNIAKEYSDCCFDLYGLKTTFGNSRYVFSTRSLSYRIVSSYDLQMKPQEANVLFGVPGNIIHQYDLQQPQKSNVKENVVAIYRYRFDLYTSYGTVMRCVFDAMIKKIKRDMHRIFHK